MTDNKEIERLAKEAGLTMMGYPPWTTDYGCNEDEICKFAALVAEECAKEIEPTEKKAVNWTREQHEAQVCADAIRSKFPMPKG